MTVSIVPEKPQPMKIETPSPDSLRSDVWIDEVLILRARDYYNIYHRMESINNLLHCASSSNYCPRVSLFVLFHLVSICDDLHHSCQIQCSLFRPV